MSRVDCDCHQQNNYLPLLISHTLIDRRFLPQKWILKGLIYIRRTEIATAKRACGYYVVVRRFANSHIFSASLSYRHRRTSTFYNWTPSRLANYFCGGMQILVVTRRIWCATKKTTSTPSNTKKTQNRPLIYNPNENPR